MMLYSFRRLCLCFSVFCLIFSAGSLLALEEYSPSSTPLTLTVFPNSPVIEKIVNSADMDEILSQVSSTQTHMTFDLGSVYEFAGFDMHYDDFGAGPTCDLSTFSSFVFALKGKPSRVNLTFCDGNFSSKTVALISVSSNQVQYYELPASCFAGVLDMTKIRMITFTVDSFSMPPPRCKGYVDIYSKGQCYPYPVSERPAFVAPLRAAPNLELLPNPSFDIDGSTWNLFTGDASASFALGTNAGEFDTGPAGGKVQVGNSGTQLWQVQLSTGTWNIVAGKAYKFTFKAKASTPFTIPSGYVKLMMLDSPWSDYSLIPNNSLDFTTNWQTYTIQYVASATASDARITFHIGGLLPAGASFYVDTLSLKEELAVPELLPNPSFNNDVSGWNVWTPQEASANFSRTETEGEFDTGPAGGKLHVTESGTAITMVQLETGVWSVMQNHTYEFTFRAKASSPVPVSCRICEADATGLSLVKLFPEPQCRNEYNYELEDIHHPVSGKKHGI